MNLEVEKCSIPYNTVLLDKWRTRDPLVVPEKLLAHKGPGISNGFGFGEWVAEEYFKEKGYHVINNEFNILANVSEFQENNHLISTVIGIEKIHRFREEANELKKRGLNVASHVDLFVYNDETCMFVEVKRGKDHLSKKQMLFMCLVQNILKTKTLLVYLDEKIDKPVIENKQYILIDC